MGRSRSLPCLGRLKGPKFKNFVRGGSDCAEDALDRDGADSVQSAAQAFDTSHSVDVPDRGDASTSLQKSEEKKPSQSRQLSVTRSTELTDDEIVHAMKSLLDKLVIDKFGVLDTELIKWGIWDAAHVESLLTELFERAATQHRLIDTYADFCVKLDGFFGRRGAKDSQPNFRKSLERACRASFERHSTRPEGLAARPAVERGMLKFKFKERLLGSLKLVAALLVRELLSRKVLLAIVDGLLGDPTAEALECLAALLAAVGPELDVPAWPGYTEVDAAFVRLQALAEETATPARVRCSLQDVLDLRANRWQDGRTENLKMQRTVSAVARGADAESDLDEDAEDHTPTKTDRALDAFSTASVSQTLRPQSTNVGPNMGSRHGHTAIDSGWSTRW